VLAFHLLCALAVVRGTLLATLPEIAYPPTLMPVDHYENFPVASALLPARLRPAVETIYAFARNADDFADEGDVLPATRIAALDAYRAQLDLIASGRAPGDPLFIRLAEVVSEYALPLQPFYDLLSAFSQDVSTTRYENFGSLRDYCRRSADPVGRLMLHLYKAATPENMASSDDICTALQLINFWQDVAIDWQKQRIYLPLDDMSRFGVSETHLEEHKADEAFRALLQFEVDRARSMILKGAPLALRMPGRIGWELRLIVQGGLRILEQSELVGHDVFRHRPVLGMRDWLVMLWRAIGMRKA
jgi:squalene synthase HpnC